MTDYKARNLKIYEERKAGLKLQEIAERYGINKESVRQICEKQKRLEDRQKYKYLYGTRLFLDHLKTERDYIKNLREWKRKPLTEADKDLIQKLESLIEVFEEV